MKEVIFFLFLMFSFSGIPDAFADNGSDTTKTVTETVKSYDDQHDTSDPVTIERSKYEPGDEVAIPKAAQVEGEDETVFEKVLNWIKDFFTGTGSAFGVILMIVGVVESILLRWPTSKPYSIVRAIRNFLESFIRDRKTGGGSHN